MVVSLALALKLNVVTLSRLTSIYLLIVYGIITPPLIERSRFALTSISSSVVALNTSGLVFILRISVLLFSSLLNPSFTPLVFSFGLLKFALIRHSTP
jgi:hypothetical protein